MKFNKCVFFFFPGRERMELFINYANIVASSLAVCLEVFIIGFLLALSFTNT